MQANLKDKGAGAFFILVGLFYGGMTLQSLPIGSAFNMGPGYFPLILSGLLIALGILIAVRSFWYAQSSPFGIVPWRAVAMLTTATIIFAAFVERLGIFPGIFITAFIASLSASQIGLWRSAVVGVCIAIFCTGIFKYGIGLPLPIIGSLF